MAAIAPATIGLRSIANPTISCSAYVGCPLSAPAPAVNTAENIVTMRAPHHGFIASLTHVPREQRLDLSGCSERKNCGELREGRGTEPIGNEVRPRTGGVIHRTSARELDDAKCFSLGEGQFLQCP